MTEKLEFRVGLSAQRALSELGRVRGAAISVGSALKFAGAGAAFAALVSGARKATAAYEVQLSAERKLAAAIAATGQQWSTGQRNLERYAAELSAVTGFGDEVIVSAEAMLVTFGLNEEAVKSLMPRVADLAAFMGTDLTQTAQMVGKAFTQGASALGRYGITLTESQAASFNAAEGFDKAAQLSEILRQNVGGAAEELNRATGGAKQFANASGDLLESVGELIHGKSNDGLLSMANTLFEINDAVREFFSLSGSWSQVGGEMDKVVTSAKAIHDRMSELATGRDRITELSNIEDEQGALMYAQNLLGFPVTSTEEAFHAIAAERHRLNEKLQAENRKRRQIMTGRSGNAPDTAPTPTNVESDPEVRHEEKKQAVILSYYSAGNAAVKKERDRFREEQRIAAEADTAAFNLMQDLAWEEEERALQEKEDAHKQLQRELLAAEKERIREALEAERDATREREAMVRQTIGVIQGFGDVALRSTQALINGIVAGEEKAMERAVAMALLGFGQQLVGQGTRSFYEGAYRVVSSYGADGSGYALMALGAAGVTAGVGMGAAGTGLNAALAGGSDTAGTRGAPLSDRRRVGESRSNERSTTVFNLHGLAIGDTRQGVAEWQRMQRVAARTMLGGA